VHVHHCTHFALRHPGGSYRSRGVIVPSSRSHFHEYNARFRDSPSLLAAYIALLYTYGRNERKQFPNAIVLQVLPPLPQTYVEPQRNAVKIVIAGHTSI
jgi:hypothetical protein